MIKTKLLDYYEILNPILDDKQLSRLKKAYNAWVINQPSIIDDNPNIAQPHHVRTKTNCGTSMKPNDLFQIPITYEQHTEHHTSGKYQEIFEDKLPELHDRFIAETNLLEIRTWLACQKFYERKGL